MGLIFIYFLGKYFYQLAERFEKSKWGFAMLGVAVYYGSMLLFGFLLGLVLGLIDPAILDDVSDMFLSIMIIPVGLLFAWILHKYLESKWLQELNKEDVSVLDSGLIN